MNTELINKVINDGAKLYSLPQTLAEVMRVSRDENSSADDLAKILTKDPALVTKVLRIVNSPFYGVGRKIGSMTQAVVTLGTRQVMALALSTSIYSMTDKWHSGMDRVRFWRHSLEVAIASRTIAEKIGYRNLEEVFVAGLLHDIGLLILENSFPEQFATVWKNTAGGHSSVDLEEEQWGTNHARIGQFLLEQWSLPETICESVGRHHNVFTPGADDPELVPGQIVNLANIVSQFPIANYQPTEARLDTENRRIIRDNLGLTPENLLVVEKHLFQQTVSESKYLEMDIGSTDDILIEANRMLFEQYAAVESLLEENRLMQRQSMGEEVKRGFLETLKSTTSTYAEYVRRSSASMLQKADEVKHGIESGAIVDPGGLVASTIESTMDNLRSVEFLTSKLESLTHTESALYYDQDSVTALDEDIRHEMERIEEPITA